MNNFIEKKNFPLIDSNRVEEARKSSTQICDLTSRGRPQNRVVPRYKTHDAPQVRSFNRYQGCEHACVYCFARPCHAWMDLAPQSDDRTKHIAMPRSAELLARQLSARGYVPEPIALGTNTDPYQAIERDRKIMRGVLEVLRDFRHPVSIVTKGTLIERDLDILAELATMGLVQVGVSITTLDPDVSRKMEPGAPFPEERLATIRALAGAGVPVRVVVAPVVPLLTDPELERIFQAAAEAGATSASHSLLRLPNQLAAPFRKWVKASFPGQAEQIMLHVRDLYNGRDYDPSFGRQLRGTRGGAIHARAKIARAKYGLNGPVPPLRSDLFRVPPLPGDQLELFERYVKASNISEVKDQARNGGAEIIGPEPQYLQCLEVKNIQIAGGRK